MMNNIYDDGVVIDRRLKEYMGSHPGTSYRQALNALVRDEQSEEQELRHEFDRRVEHQINIGFKSYDLAAERVLRSDPRNMAMAYADATDQAALARRVGEVMAAGKKAATAAKISLSDAVMRILQSEREVAQKIGGDWLDRQARIEINNRNMGGSIAEIYPTALRLVRAENPEVAAMADSGVVTETAMRTVFIAWFKD